MIKVFDICSRFGTYTWFPAIILLCIFAILSKSKMVTDKKLEGGVKKVYLAVKGLFVVSTASLCIAGAIIGYIFVRLFI